MGVLLFLSFVAAVSTHKVGIAQRHTVSRKTMDVVLKLRGGVHSLVDMDDWTSVQEAAGNKLIVLDFTASWCAPCQRIAPIFEELAGQTPEAVFLKCDVDELGELAAELGVTSMPTFLLFRSNQVVGMLRGADEEVLTTPHVWFYDKDSPHIHILSHVGLAQLDCRACGCVCLSLFKLIVSASTLSAGYGEEWFRSLAETCILCDLHLWLPDNGHARR